MISHLSFGVSDLDRAGTFYDSVLAPLGCVRVFTKVHAIGYGEPGGEDRFALFSNPAASPPGAGFHLAFSAGSREAVDRFHVAAIAAGGQDAGLPGGRPQYGPTYYAAFIVDPDGYKLEAQHQ